MSSTFSSNVRLTIHQLGEPQQILIPRDDVGDNDRRGSYRPAIANRFGRDHVRRFSDDALSGDIPAR